MKSRTTKWIILALALVLCIPSLALAQGTGGNGNGNGNGGSGSGFSQFTMNNPQPVLIYTVWGGTVAGDVASTLVVYSNGLAVWSQSDANGSGNTGCTGNSVQTVQLNQSDINDLTQQLRRAGAFRQTANNSNSDSGDEALTTITVFSNPGRGRNATSLATTFSFFGDGTTSGGTRGQINNIFTNFLNTNFGGDNGGGGGTGE